MRPTKRTWVGRTKKHESKILKAGSARLQGCCRGNQKPRDWQDQCESGRGYDAKLLQGFLYENTEIGAEANTGDATPHHGTIGVERGTVKHSVGEYNSGQIHTNGTESFSSILKCGHMGVSRMSEKHLGRYMAEFVGRHNQRHMNTEKQM